MSYGQENHKLQQNGEYLNDFIKVPTPEMASKKMKKFMDSKNNGYLRMKGAFLSTADIKKCQNVFVCKLCTSLFHTANSLSNHIRYVHEFDIICLICKHDGKEFKCSFDSQLKIHLTQLHSDRVKEIKDCQLKERKATFNRGVKSLRLKDFSKEGLVTIFEDYCRRNKIKLENGEYLRMKSNEVTSTTAESKTSYTSNFSHDNSTFPASSIPTINNFIENEKISEDEYADIIETDEITTVNSISDSTNLMMEDERKHGNQEVVINDYEEPDDQQLPDNDIFESSPLQVEKTVDTEIKTDGSNSVNETSTGLKDKPLNGVDESEVVATVEKVDQNLSYLLHEKHGLLLPKIDNLQVDPFAGNLCGMSLEQLLSDRFQSGCEDADLKIVSNTERSNILGRVDSFMWNVWRRQSPKEEQTLGNIETSSIVESTMGQASVTALLRFIYTNELSKDILVLIDLNSNLPLLSRSAIITSQVQLNLERAMNIDTLKKLWLDVEKTAETSQELLTSDGSEPTHGALLTYSIRFIIRNPNVVFDKQEGFLDIPASILSQLLPETLNKHVDDLNERLSTEERDGRSYLKMDHCKLVLFLVEWANRQIHPVDCTEAGRISKQDLITTMGNFAELIDECNILNGYPDRSNSDFIKGIYFLNLILNKEKLSEKNLEEQYCLREADFDGLLRLEYGEINQTNSGMKRKMISSGSLVSLSEMNKIKRLRNVHNPARVLSIGVDPKSTNSVQVLIQNAYDDAQISDVTIFVGHDKIIRVNSFVLSLWSHVFKRHFTTNRERFHEFNFGALSYDKASCFFKMFYTGPMGNWTDKVDLECFLSLSVLLQVPAFLTVAIPFARRNMMTIENSVLMFAAEWQLGDQQKMDENFAFIRRNLHLVIDTKGFMVFAPPGLIERILTIEREPNFEFSLIQAVSRWYKMQLCLGSSDPHNTYLSSNFKKSFKFENLSDMEIGSELLEEMKMLTRVDIARYARIGGMKHN